MINRVRKFRKASFENSSAKLELQEEVSQDSRIGRIYGIGDERRGKRGRGSGFAGNDGFGIATFMERSLVAN